MFCFAIISSKFACNLLACFTDRFDSSSVVSKNTGKTLSAPNSFVSDRLCVFGFANRTNHKISLRDEIRDEIRDDFASQSSGCPQHDYSRIFGFVDWKILWTKKIIDQRRTVYPWSLDSIHERTIVAHAKNGMQAIYDRTFFDSSSIMFKRTNHCSVVKCRRVIVIVR